MVQILLESSNLQEEETEGRISWKAFGELAQESIHAVLLDLLELNISNSRFSFETTMQRHS